MKTYRLKLEPLAPWATPWHADTLFCALAWQVVQRSGVHALCRMLQEFSQGQPPFILSDAFPEGWLPCPLSTSLQPATNSNLQTKLPEWVQEEQFRNLIRGPASLLPQVVWPSPILSSRMLHASLDRSLGTTGGKGKLFEVAFWHLNPAEQQLAKHLVVYVRTVEWLDRVVELFHSLSFEGFGKKRSTGIGAFRLVGDPEACEWMDDDAEADGFVSLSHFIPAPDDPTDGRWSLVTKYPKFSPGAPVSSPFKGRVLMLRPGSAFRAPAPIRPFYGYIQKNIHPDFPDAVQYGLAFSVPICWPAS